MRRCAHASGLDYKSAPPAQSRSSGAFYGPCQAAQNFKQRSKDLSWLETATVVLKCKVRGTRTGQTQWMKQGGLGETPIFQGRVGVGTGPVLRREKAWQKGLRPESAPPPVSVPGLLSHTQEKHCLYQRLSLSVPPRMQTAHALFCPLQDRSGSGSEED